MLKVKYVAFLFCLVSTIANAEPFKINRPAVCEDATVVLKELIEKFGEQPVWQGKTEQGLYGMILANPDSKSWSYIITDGKKACLVDSGTGYSTTQPEAKPQGHKSVNPKDLRDI